MKETKKNTTKTVKSKKNAEKKETKKQENSNVEEKFCNTWNIYNIKRRKVL